MRSFVRHTLAAACLIACGPLAEAHASVILALTGVTVPGGSDNLFGPSITVTPNNDNVNGPSPNTMTYLQTYNANVFDNLDMEFTVEDSDGTTEYFFTAFFTNNTPDQTFFGFRFELGFGQFTNFVRSTALDGLDFDTPDANPPHASTLFPLLSAQEDVLEWSGAEVPQGGAVAFTFALDIPDGLAALNPFGENTFTLRQIPLVEPGPEVPAAVPEPTSLLLLGSGLIAIGSRIRKRRG
jgi:PEP-CTERM motif